MAGTITLVSVLLAVLFSSWWLLLTAFGLNLLQSVITGFCPAALVFRRAGLANDCALPVGHRRAPALPYVALRRF